MSKTSNNTFQIDTEDSPIGAVIDFLDAHLPNFPKLFKKKTSIKKIEAEDDISQELWEYLQSLAHSKEMFMFQFQRKYYKTMRSSDLGVLVVAPYNPKPSKAFFVIEAKRLPTGSGREKEYVEGNYGGIQRYKKGHHGGEITQSAVVGYVQDKDCNHWFKEINKWINDLIKTNKETDISWEKSDLMKETSNFGKTRRYNSKNKRIVDSNTDFIELHHYLIELN